MKELLKRFARNRPALLGAAILAVVAAAALIAPSLFPGSPFQLAGKPFEPPFGEFLFGTDQLGRDITAAIFYGARASLAIGLTATALAVLIGALVGGLAGYYGGRLDAALMRFLDSTPGPVVGVMGSHSIGRDHADYRSTARLGRDLTRAGFLVATGGGPGLMEAANLGAWLAAEPDDALDDAITHLSRAADYATDAVQFLLRAREVRERWPNATTSLGVPTWIYVDEPPNQFATHVAKYFENGIRENGLLAIALGGVVFTPGGSGTAQEIFTDAAQNAYTLYGQRSPMIFLGSAHYESSPLVAALRAIADEGGWEHLVRVVDDENGVLRELRALMPAAPGPASPMRRRDP